MAQLSLSSVQKSFGDFVALSGINLQVEPGEFICLLGESGCGKTTLLRLIAGLENPSGGEITLGGEDLVSVPCHKRNIGMVFQSLALFPHLNVIENVAYALGIRGVSKAQRLERAGQLLDTVGLAEFAKRRVSALSGGQRQRVAIARALATEPSLFLMDEPFSALDAGLRERLQVEVKKLQQRLGVTTIFVTHDQREAMAIADRIVVMNQGVIEQAGTPSEIYAKPRTAFVANFIGTNNCLAITGSDGRVLFNKVMIGHSKAVEGEQTIALRPEHLNLLPITNESPGIEAEVTLVRSLGAMMETELKAGGQFFVQTSMNGSEQFRTDVGEKAKIVFDLDQAWVIPQ